MVCNRPTWPIRYFRPLLFRLAIGAAALYEYCLIDETSTYRNASALCTLTEFNRCVMQIRHLVASLMLLFLLAAASLWNGTGANGHDRRAAFRSQPERSTCSAAATDQRRAQVRQQIYTLSRVGDVPASAFPTFPPNCSSSRVGLDQHMSK